MIIDLILDRFDGMPYRANDFYFGVLEYGEDGHEITRAMDAGTEADARRALCSFAAAEGCGAEVIRFINSVTWTK